MAPKQIITYPTKCSPKAQVTYSYEKSTESLQYLTVSIRNIGLLLDVLYLGVLPIEKTQLQTNVGSDWDQKHLTPIV